MNKRILELAKQAGLKYSAETQLSPAEAKFAELIVKECMEVAASQRNPANLNYKPSERFVEDLRQHFGVE